MKLSSDSQLYDPERQMETDFSILQNTKGDLRLIASAEIYAALGNMFQQKSKITIFFLASFKEEVEFGNGKHYYHFMLNWQNATSADSYLIPIELNTVRTIILLDDLQNMPIQNMLTHLMILIRYYLCLILIKLKNHPWMCFKIRFMASSTCF